METLEQGPDPRPPTPPPQENWIGLQTALPSTAPTPGPLGFDACVKVDILEDANEYILQGVRERKERREARLARGSTGCRGSTRSGTSSERKKETKVDVYEIQEVSIQLDTEVVTEGGPNSHERSLDDAGNSTFVRDCLAELNPNRSDSSSDCQSPSRSGSGSYHTACEGQPTFSLDSGTEELVRSYGSMLDPVPEDEVEDEAFVPAGHSTPTPCGTPPRMSPPPCCKGPTYFRIEKEMEKAKEKEKEGLRQLHEAWEVRDQQHKQFLRNKETPNLPGLCGGGGTKISVLQAIKGAEQAVRLASRVMHMARDFHPPNTGVVEGAEDVSNYMSGFQPDVTPVEEPPVEVAPVQEEVKGGATSRVARLLPLAVEAAKLGGHLLATRAAEAQQTHLDSVLTPSLAGPAPQGGGGEEGGGGGLDAHPTSRPYWHGGPGGRSSPKCQSGTSSRAVVRETCHIWVLVIVWLSGVTLIIIYILSHPTVKVM